MKPTYALLLLLTCLIACEPQRSHRLRTGGNNGDALGDGSGDGDGSVLELETGWGHCDPGKYNNSSSYIGQIDGPCQNSVNSTAFRFYLRQAHGMNNRVCFVPSYSQTDGSGNLVYHYIITADELFSKKYCYTNSATLQVADEIKVGPFTPDPKYPVARPNSMFVLPEANMNLYQRCMDSIDAYKNHGDISYCSYANVGTWKPNGCSASCTQYNYLTDSCKLLYAGKIRYNLCSQFDQTQYVIFNFISTPI